eukprot:365247-Chlamydomonas_euryale.AAC.1
MVGAWPQSFAWRVEIRARRVCRCRQAQLPHAMPGCTPRQKVWGSTAALTLSPACSKPRRGGMNQLQRFVDQEGQGECRSKCPWMDSANVSRVPPFRAGNLCGCT